MSQTHVLLWPGGFSLVNSVGNSELPNSVTEKVIQVLNVMADGDRHSVSVLYGYD